MKKLKIMISNLLWKIAGISPEWGNRVMDILGYDNYCKVSKYQTITNLINGIPDEIIIDFNVDGVIRY